MPKVHLPDGRIVHFPYDMPPALIEAEVAKLTASSGEPPERTWLDTAVDALPTVGGTIGGLVGKVPVLGTALAALGGAGGEGYRQTIEAVRGNWENVPATLPDRLRAMAAAGRDQAGYEAGGRAVGAGLTKLGTKLYTSAVKPAAKLTANAPGAMSRGAREGLLSPTRAGHRTTAARQAVDQRLATAQAAGVPGVNTADIAASLQGRPSTMAAQRVALGAADETQALADRAATIARKNPPQIPLTAANDLKRTAQDMAYEAGQQSQTVTQNADEAIAAAFQKAIEQRVPAVAPMNRTTQEYLTLVEALATAQANWAKTNPLLMPILVGSALGSGSQLLTGDPQTSLGAGLGTAILASPSGRARAGIALANVGRRQIAPQIGRAVGAASGGVRRRRDDDD